MFHSLTGRQPTCDLDDVRLAHAVHELAQQGHKITFWSVDESDYWQQVVKDHMPKHLRPFINFCRANPRLSEIEGETVSVLDSLPISSCNFVYVDGGLVQGHKKIGADALLLEQKAPSDYAIQVDGRRPTVAFLKRTLKYQYDVGPGPNGVQTLFVRRAQ